MGCADDGTGNFPASSGIVFQFGFIFGKQHFEIFRGTVFPGFDPLPGSIAEIMKIEQMILQFFRDGIVPGRTVDDLFDVGQSHRFMRHDQQGNGVAEKLFDGILPVFIGGSPGLFVFGDFHDFQKDVDHVFDLSSARFRRTGKLVIQKAERLPAEQNNIFVPSCFPCVIQPGAAFIRFGAKDDAAIAVLQEFQGDAAQRTGRLSRSGHAKTDQSGGSVACGP